jgi:hypothetical protein
MNDGIIAQAQQAVTAGLRIASNVARRGMTTHSAHNSGHDRGWRENIDTS